MMDRTSVNATSAQTDSNHHVTPAAYSATRAPRPLVRVRVHYISRQTVWSPFGVDVAETTRLPPLLHVPATPPRNPARNPALAIPPRPLWRQEALRLRGFRLLQPRVHLLRLHRRQHSCPRLRWLSWQGRTHPMLAMPSVRSQRLRALAHSHVLPQDAVTSCQ
jgi:hypothetical protein